MNYREIKTKKAWTRVLPEHTGNNISFFDASYTDEMPSTSEIMTQRDFDREYYPSGHNINDPQIYPDIYREEVIPILDENGEPTGQTKRNIYKECVPRYAFAFQQIITLKQLIHLCGNETQCEFAFSDASEKQREVFNTLRGGWLTHDMEVRLYELYKSVKVHADGALAFFLDNGKMGCKTLCFANGDILYPHYDRNGKLNLFARAYFAYDYEGNATTEYLEVWDSQDYTLLKRGTGKGKTFKEKFLGLFGVEGYTLVERKPHGFMRVPIAYKRDDNGPCWSASQTSIDGYELSFSQMAQNNQAFGFPIMYLQGENVEALHDLNGTIKTLSMGPDDKAGYLSAPNASEAFIKQLDTLYKMIYEQSFVVTPPELKSGDLPAAALKILYSPAYEKATADAAEFQDVLNDVVELFTYAYGIEKQMTIDFDNLDVKWWIKPYIHVNWSTTISDLAMAVQNGFISHETASERIAEYATVGEWDRILKEEKQKANNALIIELKKQKESAQIAKENDKGDNLPNTQEKEPKNA